MVSIILEDQNVYKKFIMIPYMSASIINNRIMLYIVDTSARFALGGFKGIAKRYIGCRTLK